MGSSDASTLACTTLPWRDGAGRLRVAVAVQVTFALQAGGLAELASPALPVDLPDDTSRASAAAAAELVPLKVHAEALLTGRVFPRVASAPRQVVGFAVARGADVLMQRRLVAAGPFDDGGGTLVGRPLDDWNPEGRAPGGTHSMPRRDSGAGARPILVAGARESPTDASSRPVRLVDPEAPGRAVSFGPVAPTADARARYLAPGHASLLDARPLALPRDFDLRFFQVAPPEQWMVPLRGGERLLLVGLHPDALAVVCRLPALHAFAQIDGPGARRRAPALAGDTLWIDAARMLATVTYRGSAEIDRSFARDAAEPGAFTVRAGLAPCEDVEACLAEPRAWSSFVARERSPSPSVDPVTLESTSGLAAGTLAWMPEPKVTRRTVIVKATFDVPPDGGPVTPAQTQEDLHGDVLAEGAAGAEAELDRASDFAPFKPEADVLLRGTAHAAPGNTSALVTLTVGPSRAPRTGAAEPTSHAARTGAAEPTLRARVVALSPRAWGKDGVPRATGPFAPVPLRWAHAFGGAGHLANPAGTGLLEGSPPPLLEDPDRLMRTRADRPRPVAFAPIAPSWEARRQLTGTFDAAWQRDRWPCFPADFDPAYHQAAPPALRCPHLTGDETFRAESVRPGGGAVSGALPGVKPRAFVVWGPESIAEVPLRLDTLVLDTDELRVTLAWRGAYEPGDRPARVVVVRDDLRAPRSFDDIAALLCARQAVGLAAPGTKPPSPARSYALADVARAHHAAAARTGTAGAASLAVALTAGAGVFAALVDKPPPPPAPPPPTRAEVDAMLAAGKDLRAIDLTGADLSGIDLSGRDLRSALLARANLTGARLAGANLTGANLAGILAADSCWDGANLSQADLSSAQLPRASLLRAKLERTRLADAHLDDAHLDAAEGEGASFVRASLIGAHATSAKLPKADLSKASAARATFEKAVLDDAKLLDLDAPGAVFDGASLLDARFEKAALAGASFEATGAPGAVFEQADLTGAKLRKADLTSAVLAGAILARADLRGVLARGAVFRAADLTGARLDGADLMRATFEGADLRRASVTGANLYQAETWLASTEQADLTGAFLAGTKLAPRAK